MSQNLARIEQCMRMGMYKTNPIGCAEDKVILAGEYSFFCGQLEEILSRKPKIWNEERTKHKSDTACERWWEQTDDGINEVGLRLKLKRIEKLMSALSSLIKIAAGEAMNQI